MMTATKSVRCPHCCKRFADNSGVYCHIKVKHGGKGKGDFRDEPEESFADRAIQAQIDIACGIPTDDDWLVP